MLISFFANVTIREAAAIDCISQTGELQSLRFLVIPLMVMRKTLM